MALEDLKEVVFPVLRVRQPIGDFFIGSMRAEDLFRIAYFDIRKIRESKDGIDHYLGIQHQLNMKRVSEISRYVKTLDATFPTAVILAVDERCAEAVAIECEGSGIPQNRLFQLTLRNVPTPVEG
jgi:DGQHR domain-containing protein